MCIYQPKILTETMIARFNPTRLAIKELAGVLYFCKSIVQDIESYPGSGVVWKHRIKKYGKENIKTLWVSDWYHNPHEIQEVALHFSKENQIVESAKWANQKPEDGLNGGRQTTDVQAVITAKTTGQKRTPEQNAAKSKRQTGLKKSQQWLDNRPGYDKSIYTWQNEHTNEVVVMSRRDFAKKFISNHTKHPNQAIYNFMNGQRNTLFGWKLVGLNL